MPLDLPVQQRVSVSEDTSCFLVSVDAEPVLRCTDRRDAFRYAVLVRRALKREDSLGKNGSSALRRSPVRKISK